MGRLVIGVDPGASGGVCSMGPDGLWCFPMPKTEIDLWQAFQALVPEGSQAIAAIEKVHAMPKQGVSSTFRFGVSFGMLIMALTAARIPFRQVTPGVWQRSLGLVRKSASETNTQKKNRHKALAGQLYPDAKPLTHATADAILIAEWLRRMEGVPCPQGTLFSGPPASESEAEAISTP